MTEFEKLEKRVANLEAVRDKAAFNEHELRSQAAQVQATQNLYAPLRSDTGPLIKLALLARRMLDPDDLAHAVTPEIRNLCRDALGIVGRE